MLQSAISEQTVVPSRRNTGECPGCFTSTSEHGRGCYVAQVLDIAPAETIEVEPLVRVSEKRSAAGYPVFDVESYVPATGVWAFQARAYDREMADLYAEVIVSHLLAVREWPL